MRGRVWLAASLAFPCLPLAALHVLLVAPVHLQAPLTRELCVASGECLPLPPLAAGQVRPGVRATSDERCQEVSLAASSAVPLHRGNWFGG